MKKINFIDCIKSQKTKFKIKKREYLREGRFPIISQEMNLVNGYTNNKSSVIKVNKPIIIFGDHTRVLKLIDFDFALGADGAKIIIPNDNIDTKYFYYYLKFVMPKSLGYARHYKLLKKVIFNIPALDEQKKIAKLIDTKTLSIKNQLRNNDMKFSQINILYNKLVSQIFNNLKNSQTDNLNDICEIITDGTHQTPKYFDDGYIFLSSKNVTSRKINWKTVKYIDAKQHEHMQKHISPMKDDILLAKNGTTGVAAIVDRDIDFDIYVSLALLRLKKKVNPIYVLEYLNSQLAHDQYDQMINSSGVPNLHLKEIRKVIIKYPNSKEEQKIIVNKLNSIDKKIQDLINNLISKKDLLFVLENKMLSKEFN